MTRNTFTPRPVDASGIVTWVHIGDLHMVRAGEQNHADLLAIVQQVNRTCREGVSFVYLPGDNADNGSPEAYAAVREALDELELPWCAIVGDHDVHEKAFTNFEHAMMLKRTGSFRVGQVQFLRLNAFDLPRPDSFTLLPAQLDWVERELGAASEQELKSVLLLHCYPSDLKQGGEQLASLIRRYKVAVVDMGHTHYNELANDGTTLYAATRSTGQIEEGPVGYSIASLDGDAFSWKFYALGDGPQVLITSPADARLVTEAGSLNGNAEQPLQIRARVLSAGPVRAVTARVGNESHAMQRVEDATNLYACTVSTVGETEIRVDAEDAIGLRGADSIRYAPNADAPARAARDQDNALGAVPERDLLGTQLGPNKNGRKW